MSKHIALPRLTQLAASIAVAVGGLAFVPAANAAAPAAGTNISNIATASYTDSNNTPRSVTSNEVKTTVLQVASFTLTANQSTTANPNGQVSLSHTLTNTGNGNDTFTVNLANVNTGDDYNFSDIHVYLDADKNGVPDNNIDIKGTTINVAAGQSVGLIVVGTTSSTATAAQTGQLTVSATNVYSASINSNTATTASNTDTVTIVTGAVIQVTKSVNVTTVNIGDEIEYTLTYKNTGNSAATGVILSDALPANTTYVAGSGLWNGAARTDASGDEVGAAYNVTTNTVNFLLASVAPNTTGTLKFKVTVNTGVNAGSIPNTATFDPGTGTTQNTNTAVVTVNSLYAGTINDSATDKYADAAKTTALNKDDTIFATTQQGVAVNFGNNGGEEIWIHNTGNVAEIYNISLSSSTLPPGSTVQLFKADGLTPLTDTNGDPIVDTGSIAVLGSQKIVARVTLPSTYTGPVPVSAVLAIQPVNNNAPAARDTINLTITSITAARVDLSNGAGNEDGINGLGENAGEGAYDLNAIINTLTTNPGTAVTFPLAVTNFGTNADNFNISSDLPAGWTVKYYTSNAAGVCTTNQVTNTGNIAPGSTNTVYFCATVTPPANATPGDTPVVFAVTSAGTGLTDSMKDRVTVNTVRNVSFTPDRTGQVAPGGTVTYTHILTNNGNVTEGAGGNLLPFAITTVGNLGSTTSVYVDLDNNGIADPNELVTGGDLTALLVGTNTLNGAGLQPGESATILVKVQAPTNANAGQADTATVTITPSNSTAVSINDTTTVNIGQVRLTKQQALDTNCDGTPDAGAGVYSLSTISAKPGTCITYQITAANDGNAPVTSVVINDTVPTYTTLQNPPAPVLVPAAKGTVAVTGNALASTTFGLLPTESVNLNFTVKIDN